MPNSGPGDSRPPTGPRFSNALYYGCVSAALVALLMPLWIGELPPLLDFGGHAELVHAWARYDEVPLYHEIFHRLEIWVGPQLIPARFVSLLYPALDTVTSLRLFVTLTLVAVVAAMIFVLHVFERSRWTIFFALPFLWLGVLQTGLVNYLATMPMMFLVVGLGRLAGARGGWRALLGLCLACLAAFWTHGIGYPVTAALAAGTVIVSARSYKRLAGLAAVVPSVALFGYWLWATSKAGIFPEADYYLSDYWTYPEKLQALAKEFDLTVGSFDTICYVAAAALWTIAAVLSRVKGDPPPLRDTLEIESPSGPAWRRVAVALRRFGYRNTLLLVTSAFVLAVLFMPMAVRDVDIYMRWATLVALFGALVPRLDTRLPIVRGAIATALAVCIAFGVQTSIAAAEFQRTELASIEKLAARIPREKRVVCLGYSLHDPAVFSLAPLFHTCNALVNVKRDAFVRRLASFNALRVKIPKKQYIQPEPADYDWAGLSFRGLRWLLRWEYFLVRDQRQPFPAGVVELVASAHVDGGGHWRLYRSLFAKPREHRYHPAPPAARRAIQRGNTAIALKLFHALRHSKDNVALSPYAVLNGLAMLHAGADTKTREALARALSIPSSQLQQTVSWLNRRLHEEPHFEHTLVLGAIWLPRAYRGSLRARYLRTLLAGYGSGVRFARLGEKSTHAAERINSWMHYVSKQQVRDLVDAEDVAATHGALLTSGCVVAGVWHHAFRKDLTREEPFTLKNGETVFEQTMHLEATLRHARGKGYQLVEIPYRNDKYALILLVPDRGRYDALEKALTPAFVARAFAALRPRDVQLSLPRFDLSYKHDMTRHLSELGLAGLVGPDAPDLSGIVSNEGLHLAGFVSQATVSVQEEEGLGDPLAPPTPATGIHRRVDVDQPFLFVIRHTATKTIIAIGRVLEP